MKDFKLILHYLKGLRLKLFGLTLIVISVVGLTLVSPLLFRFLIDNVVHGLPLKDAWLIAYSNLFGGVDTIRQNLWLGALMIIAVNLVVLTLMFFRGKWNADISETFVEKLRNDLYRHLLRWPYHTHVNAKTGDLIQRCTSDVDTIRRFLAGQYSELIYASAMALIATVILFSIDVRLAWIAIAVLPIIILFAFIFFVNMQKVFLSSDEAEGVLSSTLQENLAGVRVVKAFNREVHELEKYDAKNKHYRDITFKLIEYLALYWSLSDTIILIQIFVVVIAGIFEAQAGALSVGEFYVFVAYESMILWPIRNIGRILSDMGKMLVSIRRLNEILLTPQEPLEEGEVADIRGDIVFDHVHFRYADATTDILSDVSFTVKKGETVAILGPTGSGKSSLVHLLLRLYDPTGGTITLGGHDLKTLQRASLRKQVGIVLQEPFLFSKTIYENIRLANREAKESEVMQAAKIASVHRVINEFDQGYKTLVGEKGVTLSGGQKQRIAIARTIVNQAPILIFDDSLSAVDTETDAAIRRGLKTLAQGVTTLIITHRVATAQEADKIIVLQDGKITQQGTHEELSHSEGLYRRIVEIQNAMMEGGENA